MNKPYLILALLFVCFSCEKDQLIEEPPVLSEIIYGTWELREEMNFIKYQNENYNETKLKPFPLYRFALSDSFFVMLSTGLDSFRVTESGPFSVNEQDSVLVLRFTTYKIHGFSRDTLDYRITGREGPVGRKLFKLE